MQDLPMSQPRSQGEVELIARTEDTLPFHSKVLRDRFINEYIKDFNQINAMRRIGYGDEFADKPLHTQSGKWLRETYVRVRLMEVIRTLKETDIVNRNQGLSRMWEEANNGDNDGSTRVAALAHCGKMLGMYQRESDEKPTHGLGVMLIPVMSLEEWGVAAVMAQDKLKQSAGARTLDAEVMKVEHGS